MINNLLQNKGMDYTNCTPQVKPLLNFKAVQEVTDLGHGEAVLDSWTVVSSFLILWVEVLHFFGNCGPRFWRKLYKADKSKCMKSSIKFPQSTMIWRGMSAAIVGPLCFLWANATAAVYQEVLEHFLLLTAQQLFGGDKFTFQHNLAPAHNAKSTKTWFTTYGIQVLSCLSGKLSWS